jgi:hypothetical protein
MTMRAIEKFKVGQRVRHWRNGDGDVIAADKDEVQIRYFDTFRTVGIYGPEYFHKNPDFIEVLS